MCYARQRESIDLQQKLCKMETPNGGNVNSRTLHITAQSGKINRKLYVTRDRP